MQKISVKFTKSGFEKVKNDFDTLSEKRKIAVLNLQEARSHGDLSENGAYKAARFELVSIDRELRRLKYLLRFGEVVETNSNSDNVDFGKTITVKNKEKEITFMLVGPEESNPNSGSLSIKSPIGKAVLGHKKGEVVTVFTPNGKLEWEVIKIK